MTNAIASSPHAPEAEPSKQQRLEDQALAVMGSFPAKLHEVMIGASIPAHELTSKKLSAALDDHAAKVAELKQQASAGVELIREALASADNSATYGDVFESIEQSKLDRGQLSQSAVALWAKSYELAEQVAAELAPWPAKLDKIAEETIAEVKAQLTAIGSGYENMPGYGKNNQAAERQFEHQVRFTNGRVRAALAASVSAKSQLAAATTRMHATRDKLTAAKAFLTREVAKAIAAN